MDAQLHAERVESRSRRQRTHQAAAGSLPDGVMIRRGGGPALLAGGHVGGRALPWSFTGYGTVVPLDEDTMVEVLTPPSSVAAIAAGYRPVLHPSAAADASAPETSPFASSERGGAERRVLALGPRSGEPADHVRP
jgi:hypothetical protein